MRNRSTKNSFVAKSKALNEFLDVYFDLSDRNRQDITGVEMVSTDKYKCMVMFDGKHVYANHKFRKGDIIEMCPAKDISKTALYSNSVRDMAFAINNDEYVIPLGYCQYYDILDGMNGESNCDWEWNPKKRVVVIRATRYIEKGEILVLNIEE